MIFVISGAVLVLADLGAFAAVIIAKRGCNDVSIPPLHQEVRIILTTVFALATVLTAVFLWRYRRTLNSGGRTALITLAAMVLVLFAASIMMAPLGSADNYWDTLMSRAWTVHGLNPYSVRAGDLLTDPLLPLTAREWRYSAMTYGPWWVLLTSLPTWLLRNPGAALLGTKAVISLGYVLTGLVLFRYLARKKHPDAGLFLGAWLLNPAALFEVANAGHGEGLLVLPLAIAAIGLAEKRPRLALPGLAAAALIKVWPLVILPAIFGLRGAKRRDWLQGIAASALLSGALVVFWNGQDMLMPLFARLSLLNQRYYSPGFDLITRLLGLGGLAGSDAGSLSMTIVGVLLLFAACILGLSAAVGRISPLNAARILLLSFLFIYLNWLPPWFLLTLLPFCLPASGRDADRDILVRVLGLAVLGFLTYTLDWSQISLLALGLGLGWWSLRGLISRDAQA